MSLFEYNSKDYLIDLSNKVNDVGYESLLLVYDSILDNAAINVANIINPDHKFKYIIAIRSYAASPEFVASMYETFEKIAPGRVTFNIIPGNIKFHETSLNDVVFIKNEIKTSEQRDSYTLEWIKKYNILSIKKGLPPLMISGHTAEFQNNSIKYGMTNIMQLGDFLRSISNKDHIKNSNQIVSVGILILEDKKNVSDLAKKYISKHSDYIIVGTKDDIKNKIIELESYGISDLLLHQLSAGGGNKEIHKMFKDIINPPISLLKEVV
jgi:hypothetical protein